MFEADAIPAEGPLWGQGMKLGETKNGEIAQSDVGVLIPLL